MYRVMVISRNGTFLDQAKTFLPRVNADIRVIEARDPQKIDSLLESSPTVDAFVCDHDPPRIDAFEIFNMRYRMQDFRPFILTVAEKDEDVLSHAFELRMDHLVIRDKPVMNLFLDMASKIVVAVERRRVEEEGKLNERRLKALVRLAKMHTHSFSEILNYALEEAVSLTRSGMGYMALYDSKTRQLTMHAWSKGGMEACRIIDRPFVHDLDSTGIWGDPVRLRQAVVVNDYNAAHVEGKRGLPMGHAPLNRLLMVPIIHNGEVVGTAGVANKKSEYTDIDRNQLILLMEGLISINYERMLVQVASSTERKMKDLVKSAPVGILILDEKFAVQQCNDFSKTAIGFDAGRDISGMVLSPGAGGIADQVVAYLERARATGAPVEEEVKVLGDQASYVRVIVTPAKEPDGSASGYMVIMEDETDLKTTLIMLEGVLRHVNILDQKIYGSMEKHVCLLRGVVEGAGADPEESRRRAVELICKIGDAIRFSKQFRNVGIMDPEWQNLHEVVSRAVWNSSVPEGVEVSSKVEGIRLLADSAFQRVFEQLISNSVEHGEKVTRIGIGYRIARGELTIVYSDDGVGIHADRKERMAMSEITDTERFGMFLINSILSATGFKLRETGKPGRGAVFEILVPSDSYSINW